MTLLSTPANPAGTSRFCLGGTVHSAITQLPLHLVCEVVDVETAEAIMVPLLNVRCPILTDYNICLSQCKDGASLAHLAQKAALCAVEQDPDPQ